MTVLCNSEHRLLFIPETLHYSVDTQVSGSLLTSPFANSILSGSDNLYPLMTIVRLREISQRADSKFSQWLKLVI